MASGHSATLVAENEANDNAEEHEETTDEDEDGEDGDEDVCRHQEGIPGSIWTGKDSLATHTKMHFHCTPTCLKICWGPVFSGFLYIEKETENLKCKIPKIMDPNIFLDKLGYTKTEEQYQGLGCKTPV